MIMKLEKDSIISHYKILSAIGKGGMGEVYLAEDTKLDRRVALKILPPEFAEDSARMSRFVREAKSASALNHPNILTIYEINEFEGTHFIATEFIDGKTLNEYKRDKPPDLKETLEVAIQVASALNEAHQAGIVHRDIKPDNIMVRSNGLVKILDFGIAKLVSDSGMQSSDINQEGETLVQDDPGSRTPKPNSPMTTPGMILGTPNYMSPEQARGKELDSRTDIFSFGVVLYEMLAGCLPFNGETISDIIAAILTSEPKRIDRYCEDLPDIHRILEKCLRKDRDERYAKAAELLEDLQECKKRLEIDEELDRRVRSEKLESAETKVLEQLTTSEDGTRPTTGKEVQKTVRSWSRKSYVQAIIGLVAVTALGLGYWFFKSGKVNEKIDSIAVMPFVNESNSPDTEYLSDGLTEALIGNLSQVPKLNVKSRTSVFRYKGKQFQPSMVGSELGVDTLLSGNLKQRGNDLDINLELIDAATENVIWSKSYKRAMTGILGLQEEITRDVTGRLQKQLTGSEGTAADRKSTDDADAYILYLKGRYYTGRFTKEGLDTGLRFFNQAIAKDPAYANAYAGVAYSYISAAGWFLPSNEALPRAKEAARKALAIDPDHAAALEFTAIVNWWYDWDFETAEAGFRRSLELDSKDPHANAFYGFFLSCMGRFDEGIAAGKRAVEIDPLSPDSNSLLGQSYYFARRYDLAEEQLRKTIEIDPNYWFAHSVLARTLIKKGRPQEALNEAGKARDIEGGITEIRTVLASVLAANGKLDEARKELEAVKTLRVVPQFNLAEAYAALGEKDRALDALDQSIRDRSFFVTFMNREPFLDPLRSDSRFAALLKRSGFTE